MRVVALIPARKGSKGLPNKSLRDFCGKPLVKHSIDEAIKSKVVDAVILSTDYNRTNFIGWDNWLDIKFDKRPDSLCTDTVKLDKTLVHIAKKYDFDVLILLQPTSPLRTGQDIKKAMEHYKKSKSNSLISVCPQHQFIWIDKAAKVEGRDVPIGLYDPRKRPNRQEKRDIYRENGAIYITTKQGILETGCRINGTVTLFPMSEEHSIEIDNEMDWKLGELIHG
jgi:CMP-N,N'-diacetyllegionaminic acid synthase